MICDMQLGQTGTVVSRERETAGRRMVYNRRTSRSTDRKRRSHVMSNVHRVLVSRMLLVVLFAGMVSIQADAGIPEPGVILYGKVISPEGNLITEGSLTWVYRPAASQDHVTVTTDLYELYAQNDVFSYVVRIPAQQSVEGIPVQTDALLLDETAVSYTRSASYAEKTLAFDGASTVALSLAERGVVERVDLYLGHRVLGDIDGDEVPTAVDVQNVVNAALGLDIGGWAPLADLNGDGVVDAIDVQLSINCVLGIPIEEPVLVAKSGDIDSSDGAEGEGEGESLGPVAHGTPATGMLGLGLLVAACVIAGVILIKKK